MSKKKLIRYTVSRPDYERSEKGFWRNFEFAKTIIQAKKLARNIGAGAVIERVSETRSGIRKAKQWEYKP